MRTDTSLPIYNSRNLIEGFDLKFNNAQILSTTVEILQKDSTGFNVSLSRYLQQQKSYRRIRPLLYGRNRLIYNSRNLIEGFDNYTSRYRKESTTVEILQKDSTANHRYNHSNLQQQKSYRRIRPFHGGSRRFIYNSRNLIEGFDHDVHFCLLESTTVEILQKDSTTQNHG